MSYLPVGTNSILTVRKTGSSKPSFVSCLSPLVLYSPCVPECLRSKQFSQRKFWSLDLIWGNQARTQSTNCPTTLPLPHHVVPVRWEYCMLNCFRHQRCRCSYWYSTKLSVLQYISVQKCSISQKSESSTNKGKFFETAQGDGDELSAVLGNSVWYIVIIFSLLSLAMIYLHTNSLGLIVYLT